MKRTRKKRLKILLDKKKRRKKENKTEKEKRTRETNAEQKRWETERTRNTNRNGHTKPQIEKAIAAEIGKGKKLQTNMEKTC